MKYQFFLPCAHSSSVLGILLDEALNLKSKGSEIELYYCGNYLNVCKSNYLGQKSKCISCKLKHKYLLNKYFKDENCYSLSDLADKAKLSIQIKNYQYSNVNEIKQIQFKNTNIGLGCYSTYVSLTRNCEPLIDENFKNYFDILLQEASKMVVISNQIISNNSTVCLFNGRFMDSRPIVEICSDRNIKFRCYEAGFTKDMRIKKLFFEDSLPHDMLAFANKVNYYWLNNENFEVKEKVSKDFFERKINNLPAGDIVYTAFQDKNLLPENWDFNKQNIVIYNSSEDEFVGIGGEYDNYSLFSSQLLGITAIAELLVTQNDIHLYLRIHPNLKNNNYKYHTKLLALESQYDNLTVIPADSPISSYTLLKNAHKVVVFNSTMGVEAVYAGIPVILLTAAIYYFLDIAYKPSTLRQLEEMLKDSLLPKPRLDAYKYAYYYLYIEENYYDVINFSDLNELKIHNHEFSFTHYSNLFGSNLLFWAYFKIKSKMNLFFKDIRIIKSLPLIEK